MKVGDVVVSKHGPYSGHLCCGTGIYTHAIVVSLEPFALVSEEGDMLWTQVSLDEVVALCQASKEVQDMAFARWNGSASNFAS